MPRSMEASEIIYTLIRGYLNQLHPGLENMPKLARIISGGGGLYTIRLLDINWNEDELHKEIPKVPIAQQQETYIPGDIVVVLFLYQDPGRPYILGKHPKEV